MKKIFILTGITVLTSGILFAQDHNPPPPPPPSAPHSAPPSGINSIVKFENVIHDFGQVEYNSDVRYTFQFKNISNAPVAIKDVGTSCGCTTPSYSKEPVAPGKTGSVTAKYDSSRIGAFTKTLTVYINNESVRLFIKGNILPPKSDNTGK